MLFLFVAPLPKPIKALALNCPSPVLPASKIKQTFLSTKMASLVAFSGEQSSTTLGYNVLVISVSRSTQTCVLYLSSAATNLPQVLTS